jgi:hypothetical protein
VNEYGFVESEETKFKEDPSYMRFKTICTAWSESLGKTYTPGYCIRSRYGGTAMNSHWMDYDSVLGRYLFEQLDRVAALRLDMPMSEEKLENVALIFKAVLDGEVEGFQMFPSWDKLNLDEVDLIYGGEFGDQTRDGVTNYLASGERRCTAICRGLYKSKDGHPQYKSTRFQRTRKVWRDLKKYIESELDLDITWV